MGFDLKKAKENIRIRVIDVTRGTPEITIHELRPLTTAETIGFSRSGSRFKLVGETKDHLEFEDRSLEDRLELWEKIIVRVEGYSIDGKEVAELTPEIRAMIPDDHKLKAMAQIGMVRSEVEKELKNSSLPSA